MPLKLSIALSRKVGEPNFSSRGATVGLEMEVDSNLADHPRQLHQRIARLFRMAKFSVDRELSTGPTDCAPRSETGAGRAATPAQVRAIYAISNRANIEISDALAEKFGVDRPEDLSLEEASSFIDLIKPSANGSDNSQ